MNLTDPPEVRDLTPERADQLRAGLVAAARKSTTTSTRPAWVPAITAAAGIVAVALATVVIDRDVDRPQPPPVASASAEPVIAIDRGPATSAQVAEAVRTCGPFKPPAGAEPLFSRRVVEPLPPHRPATIAIVRAPNGKLHACFLNQLDFVQLWPQATADQPILRTVPPPSKTARAGGTLDGRPGIFSAGGGAIYRVHASVGRVEMRTVMKVGQRTFYGSWYRAVIADGTAFGYTVLEHPEGVVGEYTITTEVRAFDVDGNAIAVP